MIKDAVKGLLEKESGEYLSGEEISRILNVSRNAVWKAVRQLRSEGYGIDAVSNRGYCLKEADVLCEKDIRDLLHTKVLGSSIQILKEVDSTNNFCKAAAQKGAAEGTIIFAERQTQGRGRLGKSFSSPAGKGIYMSVLLRPKIELSQINYITIAAALAVCGAIERTSGFSPAIKWVNDVYHNGKKLCGILTEASVEAESGGVNSVVTGIGINVSTDVGLDLSGDAAAIAESVDHFAGRRVNRSLLAAEVLNGFEHYYDMLNDRCDTNEIINEYRGRLFMLGKPIEVIESSKRYRATAVDIDSLGRLIVADQHGVTKHLNAGEISTILR